MDKQTYKLLWRQTWLGWLASISAFIFGVKFESLFSVNLRFIHALYGTIIMLIILMIMVGIKRSMFMIGSSLKKDDAGSAND